jgi:hypothetical protein
MPTMSEPPVGLALGAAGVLADVAFVSTTAVGAGVDAAVVPVVAFDELLLSDPQAVITITSDTNTAEAFRELAVCAVPVMVPPLERLTSGCWYQGM